MLTYFFVFGVVLRVTPYCLPSSARKIFAFCSPNPGSALSRRSTSAPSGSPAVHSAAASPSYWSTMSCASAWTRLAIDPGKRCIAGVFEHNAANSSGS